MSIIYDEYCIMNFKMNCLTVLLMNDNTHNMGLDSVSQLSIWQPKIQCLSCSHVSQRLSVSAIHMAAKDCVRAVHKVAKDSVSQLSTWQPKSQCFSHSHGSQRFSLSCSHGSCPHGSQRFSISAVHMAAKECGPAVHMAAKDSVFQLSIWQPKTQCFSHSHGNQRFSVSAVHMAA